MAELELCPHAATFGLRPRQEVNLEFARNPACEQWRANDFLVDHRKDDTAVDVVGQVKYFQPVIGPSYWYLEGFRSLTTFMEVVVGIV